MKLNWDSEVCQHAGVCVTKFAHVYSIEDGSFLIDTSTATDEELKMSIAQCPSGAISSSAED
jgi:uncharacterized Fe-S cluster protein YjdI